MSTRLLLFLSCIIFSFSVKAQKVTTQGKEFYMSFYPNSSVSATTTLYLAAKNNTTGTIINSNTGYSQPFSISAGGVTTVAVPVAQCLTGISGVVSAQGLQINSLDTISVYAVSNENYTSDGTNIIQKEALGTEYVAACYTAYTTYPSYILIEATENTTTVAITPKVATANGNAAGVLFNVTLNKGQTYLVASTADLSGSKIEVTNGCKPIAVFSGNQLAFVPTTFGYGDYLYEQLFPKTSWGKNFITATLKGRNSNKIRVYAGYNNTIISIDGVNTATIAAGTFYEFETLNTPKFVSASNPVQIMMFGVGQNYDITKGPANDGDPTMLTISPVEQVLKDGIFLSPNIGVITAHRVTIICKAVDAALTTLDGASIGASFVTVPGNPAYKTFSANIAAGQHRIKNSNGFIAYAYGFGAYQGYGFNVGSAVEKINSYFTINGTSILSATTLNLCKGQPVTFDAVSSETITSYDWNFGDGTPVVSTAGAVTQQTHSYSTGGNYTVTLTSIRTSTNTCQESNTTVSTFNITVAPDLGADKAINVCAATTTDLTTQYNTAGLTAAWTLGGTPVATPTAVGPGNYRLVVSNGSCTDTAFVNITGSPALTPAVSVAITSGAQAICAGTSVTFTATPVNGGTTPSYQWKLNGANVTGIGNTYTSTTLANTDVVTVVLTSSEGCVSTNNVTAAGITMTVTPAVTPGVAIAITTGTQTMCAAAALTFTATPTNGGTTPAYQWQVNGVNAGTNSNTFTPASVATGDVIKVILTSSITCVSANNVQSNTITMTVTPGVTPAVTVAITAGAQNICTGASVTFTATPSGGGAAPLYQWQVNGANVTGTGNTYTSTTLNNNDAVTVTMTSNANCLSSNNPVSTPITMSVTSSISPTVSIAITSGAQSGCAGSSVTFTATPVNGGASPTYQWQVNNANVTGTGNTYTSTTLANGDIVKVIMTSNAACSASGNATSNTIAMTINSNLIPAASVAITSGSQTICAGSSVTFTATPVNGGTTPLYQWQVNGTNVTGTGNSYTTTTLNNGDIVKVILTSSETCVATNNVSSNATTMTVNPNLTPSVNIAITAGAQTICAGTQVTFTATAVNGGTAPVYQWQVNGANVTGTGNTYSSATLANGDIVKVILTSNAGCLASNNVNSNTIAMTVNPNLTPSAVIAVTTGAQTICAGTAVTFSATPANGGTTPVYQWQLNGANVTGTGNTYSSATLANGDIVKVILTSNEGCLSSNNVNSNLITMTVNPNLTPAVSVAITSGAQTICAGSSVTFTATPASGGAAPAYQWKVNGANAGTNSATFTSTTLANNDVVTVVLTSSETCLATNNVLSNPITMTVNPLLTPTASITASQTTICEGTSITFNATITNGGTTPGYQWKINGGNAGSNSPTFSVSTLANNDVVTVVLTSNETCLATNNVVSNGISVTVNPNLTPTINIAIPSNTVCVGDFAQFTATITNGGTTPTYQWKVNNVNTGNNSPSFASATLVSGDIVSCVLTTSVTCYTALNVSSNNIVITVAPIPVVTLTGVPEILQGGYAQLNSSVSVPNVAYNWTPSGSLDNASVANPIASPDVTTLYKLEATSPAGCKGSSTFPVKVVPGPQIANTFTPNNDGIHDFWEIKNLFTYPNCKIQVFTRTGKLVFESIGYKKPWDGNLNGKSLPFDTYYYIIELNNRLATKPITGYVTIVK